MVQDGLVLSYARALQKRDINYQECLLVDVTDISDICVYMTYIQLALYGVPAIVRCGNTLTQKMRFKMETPLFFLHYSKFRKFYMQNQKEIRKSEQIQTDVKHTSSDWRYIQNLLSKENNKQEKQDAR